MLLAFVIKCLGTSSPVALLLLSTNDDEREYKSEAGIKYGNAETEEK